MTNPRKGDPILSTIGDRVVAVWAVNVDMPRSDVFRWSWYSPPKVRWDEQRMLATPSGLIAANTASVRLDYASPAAQVWRLTEATGDTEYMFCKPWFAPPQAEIGPDPIGTVRALEVVIQTCELPPDTIDLLRLHLDHYRHRVEYETAKAPA